MPARHPTYLKMSTQAIQGLTKPRNRKGVSRPAIKNYLRANYEGEPQNWALRRALQRGIDDGLWIQDGSYFHLTATGRKA